MRDFTPANVQLGMSYHTARSRLQRKILFEFAKRLKMDTCHRCGGQIDADEFSIDHKKPWLHVDAELFWDLENIAFSHHGCNSGHHR